jgi:transposase
MLYAQACGKNSLRDVETGLNVHFNFHYHLGLTSVSRSTIAHANSRRDFRIFEGLFYRLLEKCRDITPARKFRFKNPLHTLDSTVIDLCLELFPWATFRQTKGAIKIHTFFNNRTQIPEFLVVTDAQQHDLKVARNYELPFSRDSILVLDKAYFDLRWLYSLACRGVFFVTRAKDNLNYTVIGQHKPSTNSACLEDNIIELVNYNSKQKYPEKLRRIEWVDKETGQILVFLTNNFDFAASTIAGIYKARWQVEIFFKWIKQNLKIKTFLGTSENAVKTQIWIAMIYYL